MPLCIVIGGPNGSGKTTFAREYLPLEAGVLRFINTDEIARGLSPFAPELATRSAARIAIEEMHRVVASGRDFAIESTLSGLTHTLFLKSWKKAGYSIEIAYLKLDVPELAVQRVAMRVKQGGHSVPEDSIRRRIERSWQNFNKIYKKLADDWWVFDASTREMLDSKGKGRIFRGWKL
ncbi:MAG: zeta toxin family protein [Puniceicoccales bacterium]|jgi:predicted ABC-type ATPase|nr:zeta toxin family protein [Puniceicoccales bacterium]